MILVVFVKEPRPGRVKTRLGREIGAIDAAWWYRHQMTRLVRRLGPDRRWRTVLAVAPDAALGSRLLPAGPARIAQGPGDLGRRMARALALPGPVLVVGSDVPGIAPRHIARAFRLLGRHDVVLGPATDGGYWAIGRRAGATLPAGALGGVRWSGPHALADTLASLSGLRVGRADLLADVDRAEDLRRSG